MTTATKRMSKRDREYQEYLARKATYCKQLADATMGHLQAGSSIRLTTYAKSTTYTVQSARRIGDEIQVYDGRVRGQDSWVPMNHDQLARQLGMPTFLDTETA